MKKEDMAELKKLCDAIDKNANLATHPSGTTVVKQSATVSANQAVQTAISYAKDNCPDWFAQAGVTAKLEARIFLDR